MYKILAHLIMQYNQSQNLKFGAHISILIPRLLQNALNTQLH